VSTDFPLGTFARGRRDWAIEQLMIGSDAVPGSGSPTFFCLNNNSVAGNYLAVYGILAWRAYTLKTMSAQVLPGLTVGVDPNTRVNPVVAGMPALDGYISVISTGGNGGVFIGMNFIADGMHWLTMGDLPLFVIAPNTRLSVSVSQMIGNMPLGEAQFCSFLWGYYSAAKPPRLTKFISSLVQGA